jgi:high-affinity iron transporter
VLLRGLVAVGLCFAALTAHAASVDDREVQTIWRLLDYIGVDYRGAVANGQVISQPEFVEMAEFSAAVSHRLATLPASSERTDLEDQARALQAAVAAKSSPASVADSAHRLAAALLAAYPVPLAPTRAPDLNRGAALYAAHCASCHGALGDGKGPAAARLDPPPIDFTNLDRARLRSTFALYQVIGQGLDGTAMPGFASLSATERWDLAFYVGRFAYPVARIGEGERTWATDPSIRGRVPDLTALAAMTSATLAEDLGEDRATAVTAYLRAHPEAVSVASQGSLAVAKAKLAESLIAYQAGSSKRAADLALAAYLDGFEPLEPVLATRDGALMIRIERSMGELRARIDHGASAMQVREQVAVLDALFTEAEAVLAPDRASNVSNFVGAFTVLLREGLEALLVVVAMLAFLRKAERRDVMSYVHGGWLSALATGVLTWYVATYLITVSGASREFTEGFGSLFAAVVLLSVGIWMHGKSQADAWQRYIREKMTGALSKRSAWFLFGLTFVVVYREVFETILFYATLWSQGNSGAVLAGAATAALLLGMIGWGLLRFSRRLPIAQFFAYSAALIAVLAVVLAGKGMAALQEAGIVDVRPLLGAPRIAFLGIFPTLEAVLAQVAMLAAVIVGFLYNRRQVRAA